MKTHLRSTSSFNSCLELWRELVVVSMSVLSLTSPVVAVAHAQEAAAPDVTALIKQLQTGTDDEKFSAAVQLEALGPYAAPAIDPLIKTLAKASPELQAECLTAIGRTGPMAHDVADQLTPFLSSKDVTVQQAAIEAVRRIGTAGPQAVEALRKASQASDGAVATAAIHCLVTVSGPEDGAVVQGIPRLVKSLFSEPHVRNEAVATLIEIGPSAAAAVRKNVDADNDEAQRAVCDVLGAIGEAPDVGLLLKKLDSDDPLVARAAVAALGRLGMEPQTVVPALTKLLSSESVPLRIVTVSALGEFGPAAAPAVDGLVPMLKAKSVPLQSAAADALGRIGAARPDVLTALALAVTESEPAVANRAASALTDLGAAAVPAVTGLLSHQEHRLLAVEILTGIGPAADRTIPTLLDMLSDAEADPLLRREVFVALASMGASAAPATDVMRAMLNDAAADESNRAGAAYVLGRIGNPEVIADLHRIYSTAGEGRLRRASAWALLRLQPDDAATVDAVLPELIAATESELPVARREVLTTFSTLGSRAQSAAPAVLKLAATDPESTVRAAALAAVAEIRVPAGEALPVALAALKDPDLNVRNAGRYVLGRLGPGASNSVTLLEQTLRRGDKLEQLVAAWALIQIVPDAAHVEAAIPLFLSGLQHANPRVRAELARTLADVGKGRADVVAALQAAANDPDERVAGQVRAALEKLKP